MISEASTIQDAIVQPEILACNPESNQNSRHFLDSKFHARFQSTFCIEIQSYTGWYIQTVDCSGDSGFLWELVGLHQISCWLLLDQYSSFWKGPSLQFSWSERQARGKRLEITLLLLLFTRYYTMLLSTTRLVHQLASRKRTLLQSFPRPESYATVRTWLVGQARNSLGYTLLIIATLFTRY